MASNEHRIVVPAGTEQDHKDAELLTPVAVIMEEAQAYQGLQNIRFRQAYIRCRPCELIFPAQFAIGLDVSKLRCPVCGAQDSEIHSEETRED